MSSQLIDRFWRNLACWCASTLSNPMPIKFRDFKNPRWRRRPFWKFEKLQYPCNATTVLMKFDTVMRLGTPNTVSMLNFVTNSQSVMKILRFSIFQDGVRHYLELSNSQNFIGWRCLEGPDASLYQISSKLVVPLLRLRFFEIFNMAAAAAFDFWNREILLAIVVERV